MNWFARHTGWLFRETKGLSDNSIYKEQYQAIGKTLVSSGNIVVHKSTTEYFPILIVYPESTPYIPPTIYILQNGISEETAIEYSHLSPEEIKQNLQGNIHFFNRRHQNEDGSVCFVEMGDLHGEASEQYPIEDIIKRLRIWLAGRIPKDSGEVELFHHFVNRTYEIQYLLPDLFFDRTIVRGKFYAGLSSSIPANCFPDNIGKKTFMGVMLYGETISGVSLPPKVYVNEQLILFTQIPQVKRLILEENSQEKKGQIEDGKLIEGYWWEIADEPLPFSNVIELARYIGNGSEDKGMLEIINKCNSTLSKLDNFIFIGLRFPGRVREADWQMFRLQKGNRSPIVMGGEEELKLRLLDYTISAVYQEYLTDDYYHMRNSGRAERSILKDKALTIIGCGALGSETADALGKAGIGEIVLVDKEEMRAHNAVRHNLGIDMTCIPKSLGMVRQLVFHNPFVSVDPRISNILITEISAYFPENTIGVSSIADDNIEAYLNQQAIDNGRTVFYCRALRGGKVARIFRVIPQKDACKACLGLYLKDKNPTFVNIPEDANLPAITNECNNPVRPASAADMKVISGIFARIIIDHLQNEDADVNHWIWSSEALDGFVLEPSMYGAISSKSIPPHPNCPVCQRLEDTKIYLVKDVLDFIKKEASESGDIETGGVLIGHRKESGEYAVSRASGPGPNALRTKTRFEKDTEYCQKQLLDAFSKLGDQGLYLGERNLSMRMRHLRQQFSVAPDRYLVTPVC